MHLESESSTSAACAFIGCHYCILKVKIAHLLHVHYRMSLVHLESESSTSAACAFIGCHYCILKVKIAHLLHVHL